MTDFYEAASQPPSWAKSMQEETMNNWSNKSLESYPLLAVLNDEDAVQYWNRIARPDDIAAVLLKRAHLLEHVTGRKVLMIQSVSVLTDIPVDAGLFGVCYNPEPPTLPPEELENLDRANCRGQEWAHERNLRWIVSPGPRIAKRMTPELSACADIYNIQAQRFQYDRDEYTQFVNAVAAQAAGRTIASQTTNWMSAYKLLSNFRAVANQIDALGLWVLVGQTSTLRQFVELVRGR